MNPLPAPKSGAWLSMSLTVPGAKCEQIAGQINDTSEKPAKLRAALASLDAAMDILTPDHPDHTPERKGSRPVFFALGELAQLVREALRDATPLSAGEIAASIIAAKGFPPSVHLTITKMVVARLLLFARRGEVVRIGKARGARWAISNSDGSP
jgi:hypothetical protein